MQQLSNDDTNVKRIESIKTSIVENFFAKQQKIRLMYYGGGNV
jgi:hypothetical protein